MKKIKILFVCSGNVFRSMSAKYCVENYCKQKGIKDIFFDSAGISVSNDKKQSIREEVLEELFKKGIDVRQHKAKNVSEVNLKSYDLIVSMGYNHKKYIKENFNIDSILFNKVCYNVNYPVYDNNEILTDAKGFRGALYDIEIVKYIYKSAPYFLKNYKLFI
jgi:protein-tyrosine-phosphatase